MDHSKETVMPGNDREPDRKDGQSSPGGSGRSSDAPAGNRAAAPAEPRTPERRPPPHDSPDPRPSADRPSDPRTGVTPTAQQEPVAAASPTTNPHAVLGKTAPAEAYDPDVGARTEAAARGADVAPPRRPSQDLPEPVPMETGAGRSRTPLRVAIVLLAILILALLVWTL